jgi:hypothetical protein
MVHIFADPAVIRPTRLDKAILSQVFKQRRQGFLDGDWHFLGVFENLLF